MYSVFLAPVESQQILNVLILGPMAQRYPFLYSLFCQLLDVFIFLGGVHLVNFFYLLSLFLPLFNFVIELTLNFGNPSPLLLFVKDSSPVFPGLYQPSFGLLGVHLFQHGLFMLED